MASSVSSERAFSSAGITISKRRNRLGADIIKALQFLKCWFQRDLIFCEDPSMKLEEDQLDGDRENVQGDEVSWGVKILEDDDEVDIEPDGGDDSVFLFQFT